MSANQEEVRQAAIRELARREAERRGLTAGAPQQATPNVQTAERPPDAVNAQYVGGRDMRGNLKIVEFFKPKKSVEYKGVLEEALGLGEVALQVVTSAVATPVAGVIGLVDGTARALVPGGKDFSDSADTIRAIMEGGTYSPRTDVGKRTGDAVSKPFEAVDAFVDRLSERLGRGNPVASTIIKTAILGGPIVLGAKRGIARRRAATAEMESLTQRLGDMGIEIGPDIRHQIVAAAENATVGEKGAALVAVQAALREARRAEKLRVDDLYNTARELGGGVPGASLRDLNLSVREAVSGYDIADMPRVQARLKDLNDLELNGANSAASLEAIDNVRKRIYRNPAPQGDLAQASALQALRKSMDEFLDDQFNRDMMSGDPAAIEAWQTARSANASFRQRFSDNKTIRQLVEEEATPETMRNWVFGAIQTGAKSEAGSVVRRLKEILGEDSAAFTGLRSEFLYNIVEPLMERPPNLKAFSRRHDRFVRNNSSVMNELAIESKTSLDLLRRVSDAVDKTGAAPMLDIELDRTIAQVLFGHQIARAGLRVRLATLAFRMIRGSGASERHAVMAEMLGYDHKAPMIPIRSTAATAVIVGELAEASQTEIDDE